MKHFLVHFANGSFDVVEGSGALMRPSYLEIFMFRDGEKQAVAIFPKEHLMGYREITPRQAAGFLRLWKEVQLKCTPPKAEVV